MVAVVTFTAAHGYDHSIKAVVHVVVKMQSWR